MRFRDFVFSLMSDIYSSLGFYALSLIVALTIFFTSLTDLQPQSSHLFLEDPQWI